MDLKKSRELAEKLHEIISADLDEKLKIIRQRQVLEQSYKEFTASSGLSFNGLFARMQYVHEQNAIPEPLVHQLNSLRILCNKVVHDEVENLAKGTALSGALAIYNLFKNSVEGFELPALESLLPDAEPFARRQPQPKTSFSCILQSWEMLEKKFGKRDLILKVLDEEGQQLTVVLRDGDSYKARFGSLRSSLWKYAELNCHELSRVAGKEHFFIDNINTIIVLEPDFLVDASAVAECMEKDSSQPELFVLNKIFSEYSSAPALSGQMVNSIFDSLIHQPEQAFVDLFKEGLQQMAIPMVSVGKEEALGIHNSINASHLPQLQRTAREFQNKDLLLEASYLCPKYGLQGRLDLLYKEKGKFSILELKSGRVPPKELWPSHNYQVVAYNMIIRNAYTEKHLGQSSIFYSAAKQNPLRHVPHLPLLEQQLINTRNRIVGIMRLLSSQPQRFFDWLIKQKADSYNVFMAERLKRLQLMRENLENYEYEWFLQQVKRIATEIWQVKLGAEDSQEEHRYGHNALWQSAQAEKAGKIITDMRFIKAQERNLYFQLPEDLDITDFRVDDMVILYDQNRKIDRQEVMRGFIKEIEDGVLQLCIRAGVKNQTRFDPKVAWVLEHDIMEAALYAPLCSVTAFLEAPKEKRELLFGIQKASQNACENEGDSLEAVLERMHKAQDLHLVQGPPGTGKTSGLLSGYIKSFYENSQRRLMVISFTNRAVDEICQNLIQQGVPFIRTGNSQQIQEQLLENLIKDKKYLETEALIRENRIFVSTVHNANGYYRDLSRITQIDEIIVDEASQIQEPAILGILASAQKCILIGDQNQLPAISVQKPTAFEFENPVMQELNYSFHTQSLMERLFLLYQRKGWQEHIDMLKSHYRMHREIAALVSPYYGQQLICALPRQNETLVFHNEPDYLHSRLLWIECPPSASDFYDPLQVKIIRQIIGEFEACGLVKNPDQDLGIVAPYRAMIHALKQETTAYTIDTVERFQGSQRRIIILTLPFKKAALLRSMQALNHDGKVDRKLNVALSRASERIIILGHSPFTNQDAHYKALYRHIQSHGKIINYTETGVNNE